MFILGVMSTTGSFRGYVDKRLT